MSPWLKADELWREKSERVVIREDLRKGEGEVEVEENG